MSLRNKIVRLAYTKTELRPLLLPLLVKVARTSKEISKAIRAAPFGKKIGGELYVHRKSFPKGNFDPVLVEMLDDALAYKPSNYTVIKFSPKDGGKVSFLHYPTFDTEAHPGIASYQTVTLDSEKVSVGAYNNPDKAWILHRKELMVDPGYPGRSKFEALTRAEESAGVLNNPPGKREKWEALLKGKGYQIEGHNFKPHHVGPPNATHHS